MGESIERGVFIRKGEGGVLYKFNIKGEGWRYTRGVYLRVGVN